MSEHPHLLRAWQKEASDLWFDNQCRGIVGAVTGGGKTIFALACIAKRAACTTLIAVPSAALLDQWWEEAASYLNIPIDDFSIVDGRGKIQHGTVNIGILNSVCKVDSSRPTPDLLLVVDECHKAASSEFSKVLNLAASATIGLSATPERPYDAGLDNILIPKLGPVIYQYSYKDALRDGVIVPFHLINVVFEMDGDTQASYDKVTKRIAQLITKHGPENQDVLSALLKRSRILNSCPTRAQIALKIIARNPGKRMLVFHEDIASCEAIYAVLKHHHVKSGLYHSKMAIKDRVSTLKSYRSGEITVLVTCRALDEGFNVPETEIGIIAAGTATKRQRIQRLGRALRPAVGKEGAVIYTLAASGPEVNRLKQEEADFEGLASVRWVSA